MKTILIFLSFIFCINTISVAQNKKQNKEKDDHFLFDLNSNERSFEIEAGSDVKLKLINAIPTASYKIKYKEKEDKFKTEKSMNVTLDFFEQISWLASKGAGDEGIKEKRAEEKKAYISLNEIQYFDFICKVEDKNIEYADQLKNAVDESVVSNTVKLIEIHKKHALAEKLKLPKISNTMLTELLNLQIERTDELVQSTVKTNIISFDKVKPETVIVVEIERTGFDEFGEKKVIYIKSDGKILDIKGKDGDTIVAEDEGKIYRKEINEEVVLKKWEYKIKAKPINTFKFSYGISLASPVLTDSKNYYCESGENDGEYIITKEGKSEWHDFKYIPTVYMAWMKNTQQSVYKFSAFNPILGFGLKSDSPVIFAGLNFSFQQMVNVNLGLTMYQGDKLNPRYIEGEIVNELFEPDQLHKKTFLLNPSISLSLSINSMKGVTP